MQGYRQKLLESPTKKACISCLGTELLYVHHKDKNRKNNDITNLEYRCPSCHRKVHPTPFNKSFAKKKITHVCDIYELRVVTDNWGLPSLKYKIVGRKSI